MNKYSKTIIGLAVVWAYVLPVQALPDIQRWTNADEVPVYFVHTDELPMLDIKVMFKAGSAHDSQHFGVATFTAGMLRQGSRNKDVNQISDALNDLAVSFNAGAGMDTITLSLRSLSDRDTLSESLDLFLEIISQPTFPEDEFQHMKRKRLLKIRTQNENPSQILNRVFRQNVYAGHVYSKDAGGTEESVEAMTTADLRKYYQKYFVTANMIIVAIGAVSRQEINTISESISGVFARGMPASKTPPVPELQTAQTISLPFPSDQAHVKIGQPFIEAGHPDFFALRLGDHILGGGSFGSRLIDEVRVKRGLAYSVYSHFGTQQQKGVFSVNFQTRGDQTDTAVNLSRQIIEDFVEQGPSAEEVELSLKNIRGSFALNLGSNSAILRIVSRIARYNLGLDYLDTYLQNFDQLDAEKVHAAFKRHLHPNRLLTVIVGGNA